jgi:LruC domain-containing protein
MVPLKKYLMLPAVKFLLILLLPFPLNMNSSLVIHTILNSNLTKMKNLIMAVFLLFVASVSTAQVLSQNFNSGNRNAESANCWYTPGCSFTNTASELIEGAFTLRTGQLNGGGGNANGLISPWVKLTGNGVITFKHRLTQFNNGSTRKLVVTLETTTNQTNQTFQDTLYVFNYSNNDATTVQSASINIPAYTAGKVYRIRVIAYGTGGNSRCLIDNFSVKGTYWSDPAEDCKPLPLKIDTDGDGVVDKDDAFPADANRAYSTVYPVSSYGTLMFEDLWPANGDNDFNDLVLNYNITTITNAANKVVELKYVLIAKAIGGVLKNGFAFQLDGIEPAKIIRVNRSKAPGSLFSLGLNGTEASQRFANIPVFSNTQNLLHAVGGCFGVNIDKDFEFVTPDTTRITIVFLENGTPALGQSALNATDVSPSFFNPYICLNQQRGKEVHCADRVPSSLASSAYFGTMDDKSRPTSKKYYKNKNNLPWALNIGSNVPYAKEGKDITISYLKLAAWALTGGATFCDWYQDKSGYRNTLFLY